EAHAVGEAAPLEAPGHVVDRARETELADGLREHLVGEGLAVHEDTVAVEDHELGGGGAHPPVLPGNERRGEGGGRSSRGGDRARPAPWNERVSRRTVAAALGGERATRRSATGWTAAPRSCCWGRVQ